MGINNAILVGNVGQEPVAKKINDTTVCNFTMATNDRRFKDAEGNPSTEWHNVTAWGKLAEIIGEHVTKGTSLYIEGRLRTRKWTGDDGNAGYTTEVIADQMEILSRKDSPKAYVSENEDVPFKTADKPAEPDF